MKFAGQRNPNTFRGYYMAKETTVDGLGSFFETELRKDLGEGFRSMTLRRRPQLWQSLPAKEQCDLEQREDFVAIVDEIESLTKDIRQTNSEDRKRELQARRQKLYEQKQQLTIAELNRLRESQGHRVDSETPHPSDLEDFQRTLFGRIRHLMPERNFLADALFMPAPLRSDKGMQVVKNLMSLYIGDGQNAYHSNMRPKNG